MDYMNNDNQLAVIIKESGLEETKSNLLLTKFQDYFSIASEWEVKAKALQVTNENQKAEMQMARAGRLFLREKRLAIEESRKALKEQSLREGKAIDGIANVLKALIVPIENWLDKQEHFVEIKHEEDAKLLHLEAEAKLERERVEKEEADRKEQERIRLENKKLQEEAAKLKAEAEAKEKAMQAEREVARKKQEAMEAKLKAEAEAKEKIKLDAVLKLNAEKAKAELEAAKAKERQEALESELKAQIECPHCHKKFTLPRQEN